MDASWHSKHYAVGGASMGQSRPRETPKIPPSATTPIAPQQRAVRTEPPQERAGPVNPARPARQQRESRSTIASLRKPKPFIRPSQRSGKPKRPSLSDQLASIGDSASSVTASLRDKHGMAAKEQPLLTKASRSFTVGKLESKFPSPVHFFADRCEYVFHHPYESKQITMVMFYADMGSVSLSVARRSLQFKIPHALLQYGDDYDPACIDHFVKVELCSETDARELQRVILPKVRKK